MSFPLCANERARESFERLISLNRLPHAIIIEGDFGTGKRTLSKYIAKAFLCESENRPCDSCRTCHLTDVGTHPDIERIAPEDKKKNIQVHQIDTLRKNAYLTPRTASGKVYIIEQANTLNSQSQNKLLKVLEEPPSNVSFILLCESANQLLETVVSRCTVFSLFAPDKDSAIKFLLKEGFNRESADEALTLCKNNIGKALERLGSTKVSIGIETAREYLFEIEKGNKFSALLITTKLEGNRPSVNDFTSELKHLLVEKIKSDMRFKQTRAECTKMYDAVCEIEPSLITNVNLPLFFTALTSKLMMIKNEQQ